jgi:type VI protein secretion system component VasA
MAKKKTLACKIWLVKAIEYLRYGRSDVVEIIGLDDLPIYLQSNIRHVEAIFDMFMVWKCSLINRLAHYSRNLYISHHSKWHR